MTVSAARENRPFKFGQNDRREFIVTNGEISIRAINDSSGNPLYLGKAIVGTAESKNKWQIQKIEYDANDGVISVTWPQNSEGNASTNYEFTWNGGDTTAVTGITQGNPGEVTMASNPFTDGDLVIFQNVGGMTELNYDGTTSTVYTVSSGTGTTFEIQDIDGVDVDTSGFGAYTSGGTVNAQEVLNYTYS